jgi:hypothetical protein
VDQLRVAERPVPTAHAQPVALDQAVQVVPRMLRKQLARQLHGTQHRGAKIMAGALEFVLQEAVVEARVVGDEQAAFEALQDLFGDIREGRRIGHHRIRDAGQVLDEGGNRRARIDQAGPFAHAVRIDLDNADLGDAVRRRRGAGGFEVDKGQGAERTWRGMERFGRRIIPAPACHIPPGDTGPG